MSAVKSMLSVMESVLHCHKVLLQGAQSKTCLAGSPGSRAGPSSWLQQLCSRVINPAGPGLLEWQLVWYGWCGDLMENVWTSAVALENARTSLICLCTG